MNTKIVVAGKELSEDEGLEHLREIERIRHEENVQFAASISQARAEGAKRQLAAMQRLSQSSGLTLAELHDLIGKEYKGA